MTRLLHLSDTHATATGLDEDGVDAVRALEQVLHDARHVPELDAVVVSGDVADDGSVAGCVAVRERVGRFAAERGIPQIYSTGNHDDRANFASALGSGHLGPDGSECGTLLDESAGARAAVSEAGGLRVVTLDSLVPGKTFGAIDDDQLRWLDGLLATPAANGTVLVFHHPPLVVPYLPYVKDVVLQNIDDLADVVRGRDVRAVLTGHLHFQLSGSLAGVPVWVTPGVVTRIDTTSAPHLVRGVRGASCTVIDVDESGSLTCCLLTARDTRANEQVYVYNPLTGEDVDEPV
ncbi:metallophosphoesterase family protein [uncultured Jatrophihabitans sp.]|uniref:metallophosphoesterase family protein n=1 Tax=uncultured Jatrophihabitans sp. TaxID=1610747 RepID=UPI0035CAF3CA